jgi:hypothetical protein
VLYDKAIVFAEVDDGDFVARRQLVLQVRYGYGSSQERAGQAKSHCANQTKECRTIFTHSVMGIADKIG